MLYSIVRLDSPFMPSLMRIVVPKLLHARTKDSYGILRYYVSMLNTQYTQYSQGYMHLIKNVRLREVQLMSKVYSIISEW